MKGKYIGLIAMIVVLIVAVILWFQVDKAAKKKAAEAQTPPVDAGAGSQPSTPTNTPPVSTPVNNSIEGFPVTYNKYSAAAKELQWHLGVTQDGYIGPASIKAWQKYKPYINSSFSIGSRAALNTEMGYIAAVKNGYKNSFADYVAGVKTGTGSNTVVSANPLSWFTSLIS